MKTSLPCRTAAAALALGISVLIAFTTPAGAQTTYNATLDNVVQLIYGDITPNTSPHYDAVNFATGNGTVLKVDQNVDFYGSTLSNVFTSTTFTSTGGRVAASMVGVDWDYTTPVSGRTFIVKNFALSNVDFTTSNGTTGDVELRIQGLDGGNTSLSLANSTLSCAITPHLYASSALAFNVSGSSQIDGWAGHMSSTTALTVATGGSLRIKNCGDTSQAAPLSSKLDFNQYTNSATLNGSSLIIDNSALVFGGNPFGDPAKESTMTFSNNATLQITGLNPYSSLETDNAVFQNSTLDIATNNSRLTLRKILELDSSSAAIAGSASVQTNKLIAKGNATVTLGLNSALSSPTVDIRDGSTLTVTGSSYDIGEMTVNTQVLFPASGNGTLVVGNLEAVLNLNSGATMDLTSHASLTNNGSLNLQNGHVTVRQGSTFTNNTELVVQDDSSISIDGNVTIGGHGTFNTTGTLSFTNSPATPAVNTLSVYGIGLQSPSSLTSNSTLQMALNPTGLTADRLVVSQQLDLESRVALSLSVVSDTALALGTKFLLVDYPSWQAFPTGHFNGLPDGTAFALGLNTYQINYNDPDVQPGQTHFITVTTVPEPGALALLGLGGLVLLVCSRRASARKSTLALAVAAGLCQSAQASIMWSGPVDINIPSNSTGVYLNVVTGDFSTSGLSHTDLHAYVAGGTLLSFDSDYDFPSGNGFISGISGQSGVNNLPDGYSIGSSHISWSQDNITNALGQTASPYWTPNSTSNLVGFRFDNELTSQVHYGWARISLSADYSSQPMSIVSYAYESTPNTAIAAGAVPEPGTIALLGLAAFAIAGRALRRRA